VGPGGLFIEDGPDGFDIALNGIGFKPALGGTKGRFEFGDAHLFDSFSGRYLKDNGSHYFYILPTFRRPCINAATRDEVACETC
jgi:hypothetical protein